MVPKTAHSIQGEAAQEQDSPLPWPDVSTTVFENEFNYHGQGEQGLRSSIKLLLSPTQSG